MKSKFKAGQVVVQSTLNPYTMRWRGFRYVIIVRIKGDDITIKRADVGGVDCVHISVLRPLNRKERGN